jgi:DNA polymerase-3 subunit delta'
MGHRFLANISALHPQQVQFFEKIILQKQLGHAYLFYGYEGSGKEAFAIELAKHLLCEKGPLQHCGECHSCQLTDNFWHPDLQIIFPVPSKSNLKTGELQSHLKHKAENPFVSLSFPGKNTYITIDTIRELKNFVFEQPHQSDKKIILMFDTDLLRVEAANALLKILEEPPPYVYFFLITSHISKILPTILSRCQTIHFERPEIGALGQVIRTYLPALGESEIIQLLKFSNLNLKKVFEYAQTDFEEIQYLMKQLLKTIRDRDEKLFIETFYKDILSQSGEKNIYFFEWILPVLLDLYYTCCLNRDEIRISFFQDIYEQIQIPSEKQEELLEVIEYLEKAKQDLESEYNLNEQLIMQSCFEKLHHFFFQVPEKIED